MKVDTVASDPQSYRNMPSAGPAQNTSVPSDEHAHGAPARMGWARLLKRLFDLDLEHCPQCGGDMKIIAAIEEPEVIAKILMHLGLPARAFSGGLIPEGKNGSAPALTIPHGLCSCGGGGSVHRSEAIRVYSGANRH